MCVVLMKICSVRNKEKFVLVQILANEDKRMKLHENWRVQDKVVQIGAVDRTDPEYLFFEEIERKELSQHGESLGPIT